MELNFDWPGANLRSSLGGDSAGDDGWSADKTCRNALYKLPVATACVCLTVHACDCLTLYPTEHG